MTQNARPPDPTASGLLARPPAAVPGRQRALIVDDDRAILRLLRTTLSAAGYTVTEAQTGRAALDLAAGCDVMLLDLGLPDRDGSTVIAALREAGSPIPIIVLSSRDDQDAKVAALDLGADDYVTKPVGLPELLARLRAAERHRLQQRGEPPVFRVGDLRIDMVRRQVTVRGATVRLSAREYNLLRLLAAHAGKVLTHKLIQSRIWGADTDIQYLRIYVRALRQKIEPVPQTPFYLLTEIGVGYRLRSPDWPLPEAAAVPVLADQVMHGGVNDASAGRRRDG